MNNPKELIKLDEQSERTILAICEAIRGQMFSAMGEYVSIPGHPVGFAMALGFYYYASMMTAVEDGELTMKEFDEMNSKLGKMVLKGSQELSIRVIKLDTLPEDVQKAVDSVLEKMGIGPEELKKRGILH